MGRLALAGLNVAWRGFDDYHGRDRALSPESVSHPPDLGRQASPAEVAAENTPRLHCCRTDLDDWTGRMRQ
jgi:hypothetical protein